MYCFQFVLFPTVQLTLTGCLNSISPICNLRQALRGLKQALKDLSQALGGLGWALRDFRKALKGLIPALRGHRQTGLKVVHGILAQVHRGQKQPLEGLTQSCIRIVGLDMPLETQYRAIQPQTKYECQN